MKIQKQLLEDVLSELADLKSMVSRIDGFVGQLQAKDKVRQDLEYQSQHRAATLTVAEVMEYEPTSIDLTSEEWRWARDGLKFCIRGENTADDDDDFECWIIWGNAMQLHQTKPYNPLNLLQQHHQPQALHL